MSDQTPKLERRQYKRIPFIAEVLISSEGQQWRCRLLDISLRGMLVEHIDPVDTMSTEDQFEVSLVLSEEAVINMQARVSHCTDDRCGLTWTNIELEGLAHLRRLLELNMNDASEINRELSELG